MAGETPQTLAQMIKAKYPGVYDDMPDADLETKVKAKYPGVYDDLPTTTASAAPAPADQSSAIGRGLASFWEQVNPATIIGSAAQAAQHPIDTASHMLAAQGQLYDRAKQAFKEGKYAEGARHAIEYLLPIIGPALAEQGDKAQAGDVAGAVGGTLGLGATLVGPQASGEALAAAKDSALAGQLATTAERAGAETLADVMAPKVGRNKTRFGNDARAVAPAVAAEPGLGALSRSGLAEKVASKLEDAQAALDEAHNAQNPGKAYPTKPIVDALKAKRAELAAQPVEGSRVTPTLVGQGGPPVTSVTMDDAAELPVTTVYRNNDLTKPVPASQAVRDDATGKIRVLDKEGRPLGQEVVPGPNSARVAQIDQAIGEIQQLGPVARYEALRRIRQAYDGPAKAVYHPSITADFLAKRGEQLGAADVTGTLRDALAKFDPATATANADYALWKRANDVLQATEETERGRPRVGRRIAAQGFGAMAGEAAGGAKGMVAGAIVGPLVDRLASSGPTVKILAARTLSDLAEALRRGDAPKVNDALVRLRRFAALGSAGKAPAAPLVPSYAGQPAPMQMSENQQ